MVYKGSKSRYTKYIAPIINTYIKENNIEVFVDCFCGGANLIDKIECQQLIANDLSPTLIALHKQAQMDFNKIPTTGVTKEQWDKAYTKWKEIRKAKDEGCDYWTDIVSFDELVRLGSIEWYNSFSKGGFTAGYARNTDKRNYYEESRRNHEAQARIPNYQKIKFINGDYRALSEMDFGSNKILFYCDSPYKGTKPYGIDMKFNFDAYYNWLRETSKTVPIFISEQTMPDDFECVWFKDDVKRTNGLDNHYQACEKLFFIDHR